ncbi:MAG: hypothetical protein IPJ81_05215 [Chitinophagaceae bacterium]|nr:hypothetical protein [Chitinophagaceae bacterium]
MLFIKRVLLCFFISSIALYATAQTPKKSKIPVQKFKPPKVKTFWGRQSDSATISKEEALQMLAAPIRVADDKNVAYTITSYQFLYRRKAVTENEQTGELTPTQSIVANLLKQPRYRKSGVILLLNNCEAVKSSIILM